MARAGISQTGIFGLLENEHDTIRRLFERVLLRRHDAGETVALIRSELEAHMRAEEEFVYPELAANQDIRGEVLEAYEWHNACRTLMNELEGMEDGDERRQAKVSALVKIMSRHIELEETELFPAAVSLLGAEGQSRIAGRYMEEKPDLEEKINVENAEEEEEL